MAFVVRVPTMPHIIGVGFKAKTHLWKSPTGLALDSSMTHSQRVNPDEPHDLRYACVELRSELSEEDSILTEGTSVSNTRNMVQLFGGSHNESTSRVASFNSDIKP